MELSTREKEKFNPNKPEDEDQNGIWYQESKSLHDRKDVFKFKMRNFYDR